MLLYAVGRENVVMNYPILHFQPFQTHSAVCDGTLYFDVFKH